MATRSNTELVLKALSNKARTSEFVANSMEAAVQENPHLADDKDLQREIQRTWDTVEECRVLIAKIESGQVVIEESDEHG